MPARKRPTAIPATTVSLRPNRFVKLLLQLVPLLLVVELQLEVRLRLPRPTSCRIGDTDTLAAIWIRNGRVVLTAVLFVRRWTAMSAVTGLSTFVLARLVRLEMWKVTNTWVPFSRMICDTYIEVEWCV